MKKRKRPQKKKGMSKIDATEIMINSANKMGRHMGIVKGGCGAHRSKRDYRRKGKYGNKWND